MKKIQEWRQTLGNKNPIRLGKHIAAPGGIIGRIVNGGVECEEADDSGEGAVGQHDMGACGGKLNEAHEIIADNEAPSLVSSLRSDSRVTTCAASLGTTY